MLWWRAANRIYIYKYVIYNVVLMEAKTPNPIDFREDDELHYGRFTSVPCTLLQYLIER